MWGFMRVPSGPMGARNREQVVPMVKECWVSAEASGGSAPSTQKRRTLYGGAKGLAQSPFYKSSSMPKLEATTSASQLDTGASGDHKARLSRPVTPGVASPNSPIKILQRPMSSNKGIPGSSRCEKWMMELKQHRAELDDEFFNKLDMSYRMSPTNPRKSLRAPPLMSPSNALGRPGSRPVSPQVEEPRPMLLLNRKSGFTKQEARPGSSGTPSALNAKRSSRPPAISHPRDEDEEERQNSPAHRPQSQSQSRRLRSSVSGRAVSDRDGGGKRHGSEPRNTRGMQKSVPARAHSERNISERLCGPACAMQCDYKYQQELRSQWQRDADDEKLGQTIQNRQAVQFFAFLRSPSGERLAEGSQAYIPESLQEIDKFEAKLTSNIPNMDFSQVLEFNPRQTNALRHALRCYAQASRPFGKGPLSIGGLSDLAQPMERLFRPTFCRFITDSKLVFPLGMEGPENTYHRAVRQFDNFTKDSPSVGGGSAMGNLRAATIEQCITLVGQIICQTKNPAQAVINFFEEDLPEAQKIVQALLNEARDRSEAAIKLMYAEDQEVATQRKSESMTMFGSPPPSYEGSMKEWARGLKHWMTTIEEQALPEAISERIEQQFALENYLGDALIEPGIVHVVGAYDSIFRAFFNSYCDEERITYNEGSAAQVTVKHMSCAAFFRFCVDLNIFPKLCSFEEARAVYRAAECLQQLEGYTPIEKLKRAYKTVHSLLQTARMLMPPKEPEAEQKPTEDEEKPSEEQSQEVPPSPPDDLGQRRESRRASMKQPGMSGASSLLKARGSEAVPSEGARVSSGPRPSKLLSPAEQEALKDRRRRSSSKNSIAHDGTGSEAGRHSRRNSFAPSQDEEGTHEKFARQMSNVFGLHEEEEVQEVHIRVKDCIDLTWIRKEFKNMSQDELRAYSLLAALGDCVADRFLCVRGLFLAVGVGDTEGIVGAEAILTALSKLHVDHDYDSDDMEAFVHVINPKTEDGTLETSEIEKAVVQVRKDQKRRFPWLKDEEAAEGGANALGDEARRLDDEDVWFQREALAEANNQHVTAFGYAAFAESLVRVGIGRMHSSGVSIQASAPGGVKGMWLMTFLRYQFLMLLQDSPNAPTPMDGRGGKSSARSPMFGRPFTPADSEVSTRPPTRENFPAAGDFPAGRSPTPTAATNPQPWASPVKKDGGTPAFGLFGGFPRGSALLRAQSEPTGAPAEEAGLKATPILSPEEMPPSGSSYTSCKSRLFGKYPDLFTRFDQGREIDDVPIGTYIEDASRALEICSVCQRRRSRRGVGDVFCHVCSGVDKGNLSHGLLYPVFQRRRLKISMQAPDRNSARNDRNLGASTETSLTETAAEARKETKEKDDGSRRMHSHSSATPSGSPNISTMQIDESQSDANNSGLAASPLGSPRESQ
mmetsp:Transcript_147259/g.274307  ORF Transcript_147259/g.274307 Transcript_147259/m.274307 type:complete len:1397 (-) Transcript_147259:89-4279(-)